MKKKKRAEKKAKITEAHPEYISATDVDEDDDYKATSTPKVVKPTTRIRKPKKIKPATAPETSAKTRSNGGSKKPNITEAHTDQSNLVTSEQPKDIHPDGEEDHNVLDFSTSSDYDCEEIPVDPDKLAADKVIWTANGFPGDPYQRSPYGASLTNVDNHEEASTLWR